MRGKKDAGDRAAAFQSLFLMLFNATSHIDRNIIAIALPAIGTEFLLNDAQLGILSGVAFSLIFGVAVVPLGIWTAAMDRRHVLFSAAFGWSAATALSALSVGFWSLVTARLTVGISEAAGLPMAHRSVSEHGNEVRAFAKFNAGASIGIAVSLVGGGVIVQTLGWRAAFLGAALPGLILAPFAYLAFAKKRPTPAAAAPSFKEAGALLYQDPAKRLTYLGAVLTSIISFGMVTWLPSFFIRTHGVSSQATGLYLALAVGLMGAVGTVVGGRITDRLGKRDFAWIVWFPALLLLVGKPMIAAALFVSDARLAMALLVFPLMVGGLHFSTSLAVLHKGLPGPTRHLVSTHLLMTSNLIGFTLGPLIVGIVSWVLDRHAPQLDSLSFAIFVLQWLSALGLYFYWRAARLLKGTSAT